jgi:hypothetical protein
MVEHDSCPLVKGRVLAVWASNVTLKIGPDGTVRLAPLFVGTKTRVDCRVLLQSLKDEDCRVLLQSLKDEDCRVLLQSLKDEDCRVLLQSLKD